MENELECLGDRKGHGGHLAKKFLKNIIPSLSYRGLPVVTRQQQVIGVFITKRSF